jgi:hypothetical protein
VSTLCSCEKIFSLFDLTFSIFSCLLPACQRTLPPEWLCGE